jgi:hypothetical protein
VEAPWNDCGLSNGVAGFARALLVFVFLNILRYLGLLEFGLHKGKADMV